MTATPLLPLSIKPMLISLRTCWTSDILEVSPSSQHKPFPCLGLVHVVKIIIRKIPISLATQKVLRHFKSLTNVLTERQRFVYDLAAAQVSRHRRLLAHAEKTSSSSENFCLTVQFSFSTIGGTGFPLVHTPRARLPPQKDSGPCAFPRPYR